LPSNPERSTLGENTVYTTELKSMPLPKEKIVIGVYKFRDQTGQYKP
jgi:curli production assembly/transport component CsgG